MKRLLRVVLFCLLLPASFVVMRRSVDAPFAGAPGESSAGRQRPANHPAFFVPAAPTKIAVTVRGCVDKPGDLSLSQPSLAVALRRARPNALSALGRVVIMRPSPKGGVERQVVDALAILHGQAPDLALRERDIVFVPEILL